MWNANEVIVISDLHLAAERDQGSFQSDRELTECLRWVLTTTSDCLVVLAGDAFDLLNQNRCLTRKGFDAFSCQVERIIEHHPEIFDALSSLAQSPRHKLVIMSGECDSELVVPQVQQTVEHRLGVNCLNQSVKWLVNGEAQLVRVGSTTMLIEHGNGLDPWNRINYASLQLMLSLASRNLSPSIEVSSPLGVELWGTVIKDLRSRYRWVDCLKPIDQSVLPLLWLVASESQKAGLLDFAERFESMKTEAAVMRPGNSHTPISLFQGDRESDRSERDFILKEWLDSVYEQQHDGGENDVDDYLQKVRVLSNADNSVEITEADDTSRWLKPVFDAGADLVIHGHTHAAKAIRVDRGLYLNTGAWTQIIRLPRSYDHYTIWRQFLEQLGSDQAETFARRTLAHVAADRSSTSASLREWHSNGPVCLFTQHFRSEN